uniref:GOLD domain-containing protein n=1 Tax=Panagrellus redivivus TaxID=6233 RepID=A0A7E4UR13_PANRE
MRLLVELLLGLVFLTPFADAWLYYRVKGKFTCFGKPTDVNIKIIEHDPNNNDVIELSDDSTLDYTGADEDFLFYPHDNLELSIHVTFDCRGCKGELYQYIYHAFQFEEEEQASANPMIFGSVELSHVCKFGRVVSWYTRHDKDRLKKKWFVRNKETNIRDHFKVIN